MGLIYLEPPSNSQRDIRFKQKLSHVVMCVCIGHWDWVCMYYCLRICLCCFQSYTCESQCYCRYCCCCLNYRSRASFVVVVVAVFVVVVVVVVVVAAVVVVVVVVVVVCGIAIVCVCCVLARDG